VKVAVIGTGFGRRVVAPVFDATDRCEVVDVVSARDDDAVRALVSRPDVDLVSVHSPPFLHAAHVRLGLGAGKAVLCDKPFAMDPTEADALVAEARAAGVVALCNFEFRYAPARRAFRDVVRGGTLGEILLVHWVHETTGSTVPLRPYGWLFDAARGGGWIGAWASHAVDALRFIFDAELEVRTSHPTTRVTERPGPDGGLHACTAEDTLEAALELSSGGFATFKSTFAALESSPPRLTVFAEHATAELVNDEALTVQCADGISERRSFGADGDRHLVPMQEWAKAVRDAVESGKIPDDAPTFEAGAAVDKILQALRANSPNSL
jgi:predicted dehydrogenase